MKIQSVDCRSANAPQDLARSLRETGFAVLVNHGIDASRIEQIYQSWANFFARSEYEKAEYVRKGNAAFSPI